MLGAHVRHTVLSWIDGHLWHVCVRTDITHQPDDTFLTYKKQQAVKATLTRNNQDRPSSSRSGSSRGSQVGFWCFFFGCQMSSVQGPPGWLGHIGNDWKMHPNSIKKKSSCLRAQSSVLCALFPLFFLRERWDGRVEAISIFHWDS